MRWLILMLATGLMLVTVACGGHSGDTATPVQTPAITPGGALPLPGDLRAVSSVDGFQCTGSEYQDLWGNNLVEVDGTSLEFTPDWPGAGSDGLAFAIYHFEFDGAVVRDEINLTWSEHGDFGDLWLGLADFNANCWEFSPGADGTIPLPITEYMFSDHRIFLVIAITGTATWVLDGIDLGSTPTVTGVTPLAVPPGAVVTLVPEYSGIATAWTWTVGAAGSLDDPATEQPSLTATDTDGIYAVSVTAANGFGTGPAYEFELAVGPPVITGVSPNGITDTAAFNWFIPEYQGQVDTWSWTLAPLGNATIEDAEQGLVTAPYNLGIHDCSVTATNAYGSCTYDFKAAVWHEEEIANTLGDRNGHTDIEIDAGDIPHIVYRRDNPESACYATKPEDTWLFTTLETGSNYGDYNALELDPSGRPGVVYRVYSGQIHYAKYTGSEWLFEELALSPSDQADLKFDPSGAPWIAYATQGTGIKQTNLINYAGDSWTSSIVFPALSYNAELDFDSTGNPVVAVTGYNLGIIVVEQRQGNWVELPPVHTLDQADVFSFIIGDQDEYHLLFQDIADQSGTIHYKVKHAVWDGTAWDVEVIKDGDSSNSAFISRASLALDSTGNLHAVYGFYTPSTDRQLWYARQVGGAWEHFLASNTYSCAHHFSIDLDSNDQPYLVHTTGLEERLLINTLNE